MIKRKLFAAVTAATLGMTAASQTLAADVTLKLHHLLPAMSFTHKNILEPWAEAVEKGSDGRIEVKIYPAMSLGGKPPQLIDQAIDGFADVVWTLPGYNAGRFPAISAFELPFMVTNAEDTSQALQTYYEQNPEVQAEFDDLHPLFFWVHDPGVVFTKNEATLTVDSFASKKIRNPSRPIGSALSLLGASPVGMPVPEIPQALAKGVIDGAVVPYEIVPALRLHELVDHATEIKDDRGHGLYTAVFILGMNKAKYESLDADLKAVIDEQSGIAWAKMAGNAAVRAEVGGRALIDEKAQRHQMSAEEVAKVREMTASVTTDWVQEMNDLGLDGQKLLDSANEQLANFSK